MPFKRFPEGGSCHTTSLHLPAPLQPTLNPRCSAHPVGMHTPLSVGARPARCPSCPPRRLQTSVSSSRKCLPEYDVSDASSMQAVLDLVLVAAGCRCAPGWLPAQRGAGGSGQWMMGGWVVGAVQCTKAELLVTARPAWGNGTPCTATACNLATIARSSRSRSPTAPHPCSSSTAVAAPHPPGMWSRMNRPRVFCLEVLQPPAGCRSQEPCGMDRDMAVHSALHIGASRLS